VTTTTGMGPTGRAPQREDGRKAEGEHAEFFARWERRRDELRRLNALVDGAVLIDEFLDDVEQLHRHRDDEVLTLARASAESGYSVDHLGRLIREGRLPNVGRQRAPRLRRVDIPRKPGRQTGSLASAPGVLYDVDADVRFLRGIRRGE